jgi:uncharacterized protein (DUF58 family)
VIPDTRATFPLIPRHRLTGLPFGSARSSRRGRGSDLAGFRAYVPGDPISTIDWRASARLSTARGDDEFVVRERFAEEAPRVVVFADRRPSMGLYPGWSPWLSKPRAVAIATAAIAESTAAARGSLGYLDLASDPEGSSAPFWIAPRERSPLELFEVRARTVRFDADEGSLERGLAHLSRAVLGLAAGSFVFVLSDFLAPLPRSFWLTGIERRWELVPVVVRDPVWERSFPLVGPVTLPIADPQDGSVVEVRLTRAEARAERERREQAHAQLLALFEELALDPVLLESDDQALVRLAFLGWAEARRRAHRQRR